MANNSKSSLGYYVCCESLFDSLSLPPISCGGTFYSSSIRFILWFSFSFVSLLWSSAVCRSNAFIKRDL